LAVGPPSGVVTFLFTDIEGSRWPPTTRWWPRWSTQRCWLARRRRAQADRAAGAGWVESARWWCSRPRPS